MNIRLTLTAAAAVILTSVSLYPLIQGGGWFWAGAGAVIAVAAAGIVSRLPAVRAAAAGAILTLIAVVPMLMAPSWALRAAAVVLVAIPAAALLRRRVLQAAGCLMAYLAVLLIYLNLVFAAGLALAGVIPTRASVAHLGSLLSQGINARSQAPPVPGTPSVVLLAAGGIGLIAVVTDLLAARLRSPAPAGLPLFALYCVRITTSASQSAIGAALVFCLGMIGYLALLAVDGRERLHIWGRVVTVWDGSDNVMGGPQEGADTRGLAASGRRIGLAAACVALVLPLVLPGVSVHDLLRSGSQGAGLGGSAGTPISLPTPLVQMRAQLTQDARQTVLTYTTTAADPPEQYLQIYVLNYKAGTGDWSLVPLTRFVPASSKRLSQVPGLATSTPVTHPKTEITFSRSVTSGYNNKLNFLPLPYAPSSLRVTAGAWQEDDQTLMVYTSGTPLSSLSYTVTSTVANPGAGQLGEAPTIPSAISKNYLNPQPSGADGRELKALAGQITAGAITPYQKALKLQSYFTSGDFAYNVDVNLPNSTAGLIKFLFSSKSGMCQQFAIAMATLARAAGIPSRIAVGYTAGSRAGKGTWKVTTADAHAWPELYFAGIGWLRFEPTPGGANGQGTATVPQYAPGQTNSGGTSGGAGTTPVVGSGGLLGGAGSIPGERRVAGGAAGSGHHAAQHNPLSLAERILLAAAIIVVIVLVTPMILRILRRRRRRRATGDAALAHAAWGELRDSLADYGYGYQVSETPRAVARRLTATVRLDPAARQAVRRIVSAEERARYATAPLSSSTLAADTVAVRRALSQEAGRRARLRALLLPRSVLGPVRQALPHALDVFGWMEALGLRFRVTVRQQPE